MAQVEYLVVAGGGRGGSESPDATAAPSGGSDGDIYLQYT